MPVRSEGNKRGKVKYSAITAEASADPTGISGFAMTLWNSPNLKQEV